MPLPFGHEISVRIFSLGINPLFEKMINKKIEFLSYRIILVMLLYFNNKFKRAALNNLFNEVNGAFL